MAGSSATCTKTGNDGISTIDKYQIAFVADDSTGAFDTFTFSAPVAGKLCRVTRNPGTTAPDDSNSAYVTDGNGVDLLQGNFKSSGSATISDSYNFDPPAAINDALVVTLAGNTTASAEITITLYIDTITAAPRAA